MQVMPYEVVPIIDIPGYGDTAAVAVSDELKIKVGRQATHDGWMDG
jgi:hypothetical protein